MDCPVAASMSAQSIMTDRKVGKGTSGAEQKCGALQYEGLRFFTFLASDDAPSRAMTRQFDSIRTNSVLGTKIGYILASDLQQGLEIGNIFATDSQQACVVCTHDALSIATGPHTPDDGSCPAYQSTSTRGPTIFCVDTNTAES